LSEQSRHVEFGGGLQIAGGTFRRHVSQRVFDALDNSQLTTVQERCKRAP
jgi:hypothetical protein